MRTNSILITKADMSRLRTLIEWGYSGGEHDHERVEALLGELARASEIDLGDMPADVVTMNSRVCVCDPQRGAEVCYTLVLPGEADAAAGRLSVLAPLGTALLGRRTGEEIAFHSPAGKRRLRIERILYQPEAERRRRDVSDAGGAPRAATDVGATS